MAYCLLRTAKLIVNGFYPPVLVDVQDLSVLTRIINNPLRIHTTFFDIDCKLINSVC
jgi:hypothetical protein